MNDISEEVRGFRPVMGQTLRLLVLALPWLVLGATMAAALSGLGDPMFLTGLLAAAAASFLFQTLLARAPEALGHLWSQGSIVGTAAAYRDFVSNFQRDLNRRLSWLSGFLIAALMFLSYSTRFAMDRDWWRHPFAWMQQVIRLGRWDYLAFAGLQVLLAFLLGLLLWRMLMVALMVARLGNVFDLHLQPQHPDASGGLRPLGDLCLINALILTAPAIFLASWLIVIAGLSPRDHYAVYVQYYQVLLLVVFMLALGAFVLPLYFVHRAMVRQRMQLQIPLYHLSLRIDELTRRLLNGAPSEPPEELAKLSDERDALSKLYGSNSSIPVWPFDAAILRRFTIAQFIPLLSLTGIAPNIVQALKEAFPR